MSVEVLCKPENNAMNIQLVSHVIRTDVECDELFLPISQSFQRYLEQFCAGLTYYELIQELKRLKLILEPFGAWQNKWAPIVKVLPMLKEFKDINFHCYKDPSYSKFSAETLIKMNVLLLQGSITEEISTDDWIKMIQGDIEKEEKHYRKKRISL